MIKFIINSGIPLLIQGGANYSEPKKLFRNRGGPFLTQQPGLVEVVTTLIGVLGSINGNKPHKDPDPPAGGQDDLFM